MKKPPEPIKVVVVGEKATDLALLESLRRAAVEVVPIGTALHDEAVMDHLRHIADTESPSLKRLGERYFAMDFETYRIPDFLCPTIVEVQRKMEIDLPELPILDPDRFPSPLRYKAILALVAVAKRKRLLG